MNSKQILKDIFFTSLGVFSAAIGLKSFLLPNNFIDGGAVGISLLVAKTTDFALPLVLIVINFPFIILGYNSIGKVFAFKTAMGIILLSAVVAFVPFPEITHDKLLVAIFGGFFLGGGIGFAVRGGGVLDGTEVLAINMSKRFGVTTMGDIIIIINVIIFLAAAIILSIETAMYSMLTYIAASKAIDFIVEGIEEYTGVTIISTHSEEMRQMVIEKMGRGVTLYKGEKGYGKRGVNENNIDIVYTVLTRLEIGKLNGEIEKIDKDAFVIMNSIKDTKGGMIKRRPLVH
ncbi:MAG TPA: YitT family protein [Cytophagaceae bacterium]|nr:YitT family protein [Cytophagaceae bacterium]